MGIFREAKRLISQHFERRYWYEWRKVPHYWYNDETNKYEDSSYPKNAKIVMNSTWEGEYDLWCAMLLKLDHMFHNLRKYGVEKDYYFFSNDIKEYGTDEDKKCILKWSLDKALQKDGDHLFLFNLHTDDKEISENKLVHFNLKLKDNNVMLCAEFSKEIPQNEIPEKKKLYTLLRFENGKIKSELASQYRVKKQEDIFTWNRLANEDIGDFILNRVAMNFDRVVNDYIKACNGKIIEEKGNYTFALRDILIELVDTSFDLKVEDKSKLSKELKQHAIGNFVKCRDILHLRHLIKKMLQIEDTNDKYFGMWKDVEDDEERSKKCKEAQNLYLKDRKEAYQKITDFMYEKALRWWD